MLTADAFGVLPPIARLSPAGRDVSLPVGVYGEGCRHREGRDRAQGHVQHVLRRAVHGAAPDGLRAVPGREDRAPQRQRLAGEHRVDGWTLWHRIAHEDRPHAGHDSRRALRCSSTRSPTRPTRCSTCRFRSPAPACRQKCSSRGIPGRTPPPTTSRPGSSRSMFADNFKSFEADASADVRAAGPRAEQC